MAFLQTLDAFTQPLGAGTIVPKPYTIDAFTQPLTPPATPEPRPSRGGGAGFFPPVCPPGMYWNPVFRCCLPRVFPSLDRNLPEETPSETIKPGLKLDFKTAKATAAAIGLTIKQATQYEILATKIGSGIGDGDDEDQT